jgi:integrase
VSVEKVQRRDGPRYVVWWKDELRRSRNKTFRRKADADAYDAKIKLDKRAGDLGNLDAGKRTLREFHGEWKRLYAEPRLAKKTLVEYERYLKNDILPALGHLQLRRITPRVVQRFAADLGEQGRGNEAIRKMLAILQGILQRAVEWEELQTNPVRVVKKPPANSNRQVDVLAPSEVERLRGQVLRQLDATLISVIAYAGLRPGEALALTWADIRDHTILVNKSLSLGEIKTTKTRTNRTVPLRTALAQDLGEWKLASGRPDDNRPVFPAISGGSWSDHDYRNWRIRTFKPAVTTLGITCRRPYDLRHSHASLRFAEAINPAEIAEEMGHSLETLLNTYTHVIEDLAGQGPVNADDLIAQARSGLGLRMSSD